MNTTNDNLDDSTDLRFAELLAPSSQFKAADASKSLPLPSKRNLKERARGQRGFHRTRSSPHATTATTKKKPWKFFRRRPNKQKDADATSIQDTEASSSSVAQSLKEALAELDFLDDIVIDDFFVSSEQGEGSGRPQLVNQRPSSLSNLITSTLSDPDPSRQMKLLSSKEDLKDKIHKDYTEVLLEHSSMQDHCLLEAHLLAATHVVHEVLEPSVQELIQSATMPETLQEMVFTAVENYIQPRMANLYSQLDAVAPADAAKLVSWIDAFLATVQERCPLLEPAQSWCTDCSMLLNHYLDTGVRKNIQELVQRSLDFRTDAHVRQKPDGTLVTAYPNQIGFLCDIQLSVAKELLPAEYTERVLAACNEELVAMVGDLMFQVEAHWKETSSSRFCAIINDASILSEACHDRNRLYLSTPDVVEMGAELTRELAQVSLHATRYLCERILLDLQEPEAVLTRVGDSDWESDESGSAVERTVATLKDFFRDLERWLISDYFFPKVLKHCLDLVLQIYLQSFFSNTMHRGVRSPNAASKELDQDFLRLVIFFNGDSFAKYSGAAGFYSQHEIRTRLHILKSLSMLVDPSMPPNELCDEIKVVLVQLRCGENGVPTVLHLAGLRKRGAAKDAIEWLKAISQANKLVLKDAAVDSTSPCYKVPDLRNSKYVRNIRPTRRQMDREISDTSRSAAETTYRLVRTRAPTHAALAVTANCRAITSSLTGR